MTSWKFLKDDRGIIKPSPYPVVQMLVYDSQERFLLMHRSKENRSAANVWSFPSGLHDIGETQKECALRELEEEYGLQGETYWPLGVYENIAGDENATQQFHWVITFAAVRVADVTQAVNKEPHKHDVMRTDLTLPDLLDPKAFLELFEFHPSFHNYFLGCGTVMIKRLFARISEEQ